MRYRRWLALWVAAALFACGKPNVIPTSPSPSPGSNPVVVNFYVNGPLRVEPGQAASFTAKALMSDGSLQDYTQQATWKSSDTSVLTFGASGQATGQASGETRVTASYSRFSPSLTVMVIPLGTFRLSGIARELNLPVVGATVAVTSGHGAGLSAVTDSFGNYRLYGVVGPIEVQITKPGYTPETKTANVSNNTLLDFPDLVQSGPFQSVSGTYTLSLSALDCYDTTRPLPEEYRHRTYTAVVAQDGSRLTVTVSGADFVTSNGQGNSFSGRVQPDGVVFQIVADYYYLTQFDVLERVAANQMLALYGSVAATATPAGISGTLTGGIILYAGSVAPPSTYVSSCDGHYQFTMTPLNAARVRR